MALKTNLIGHGSARITSIQVLPYRRWWSLLREANGTRWSVRLRIVERRRRRRSSTWAHIIVRFADDSSSCVLRTDRVGAEIGRPEFPGRTWSATSQGWRLFAGSVSITCNDWTLLISKHLKFWRNAISIAEFSFTGVTAIDIIPIPWLSSDKKWMDGYKK